MLKYLFLAAAILALPAQAATGTGVDDRAGFFSQSAVSRAERLITETYERTEPHKDILVATVPTLPPGNTATAAAESLFRERGLNGVLVYIVKEPHRLVVTVGRQTEARFAAKEQVRNAALDAFKRKDYDGGLLAAVSLLNQDLTAEFSPHRSVRESGVQLPYARASYGSRHFGWIGLIALGLGIYFIVRLFARRSYSAPYTGGSLGNNALPNPLSQGGGGPMGGGFGRSFFGGLLGAVGGNWLYDRFRGPSIFGGGFGGGGMYPTERQDDYDVPPPSDDGDVGSSSSGSWDDGGSGDSGGGDSGGDSGGDW